MRKLIKILALGGALATVFLVVMGVRGRSMAHSVYETPGRLIETLPEGSDPVEGERLASIYGCHECHGDDLSGRVFIDAPPFLVVTANLTDGVGGIASEYRGPADWDRAIRYRIRPDGRGLLPMMPSENYHRMSDQDLGHLIAYLMSAPLADRELPRTEVRLMGLPIAGFGVLHPPRDQGDAPSGPTPPVGPTPEYGAYLSNLTCVECHGDDLRGGPTPGGGPKAPGLAVSGRWRFEDFVRAMREGRAPGRDMDPAMPSAYFSRMTDVELQALHAHLATLEMESPQ
ncbi:MAG: hypothetical protein MJB57_15780 [Gemmatimonadetes bacterium]|nr:hypothetical protein [Gemmatimonadota bacterium]